MKRNDIKPRPDLSYLIVFWTYGGLILVVYTSLFWYWSGMASLGAFYLLLIAPILMAVIAKSQKENRERSKFHSTLYYLASGYLFFIIIIWAVILVTRRPGN